MKFEAYKKLFDIYTEENPSSITKTIIKISGLTVFWLILLLILFKVFAVSVNAFMYWYIGIYFVLELLLLFAYLVLYESTSHIIGFSRTVPINAHQFYFYHFILSSLKVEYIAEYLIVSLFLIAIGTPLIPIISLIMILVGMKFIRNYGEFFIYWMKKREVTFPYWSIIFFCIMIFVYLGSGHLLSLISNFAFTLNALVIITITLSLIALITYPVIINELLRDNHSNTNTYKFNQFTGWIASKFSLIFRMNKQLQSLVKYNGIRLLRNPKYIGMMLRMNSTILLFLTLNKYIFSDTTQDSKDVLFNVLYISFILCLLNLSNVKLTFKLNEKQKLDFFPVNLNMERVSLDVVNGIFIFLNFSFLMTLYNVVHSVPLVHIFTSVIAFICFFMLGLILESTYIYHVTKKIKVINYILFFTLGIALEVAFVSLIDWGMQLIVMLTLMLIVYSVRYKFPYLLVLKNKKNESTNKGKKPLVNN